MQVCSRAIPERTSTALVVVQMFGPMCGPCAGIVSMSAWLRLSPGVQPKWWKRMLLNTIGLSLNEFLITSNVDPCKLAGDKMSVDLLHDRLIIPFLTVALARECVNHSHRCLLEASNFPATLPLLMIHGTSSCFRGMPPSPYPLPRTPLSLWNSRTGGGRT